MFARSILIALALVLSTGGAYTLELPKEVTPAIRVACEQDVRRLCIRKDSTVATVKSCVIANFSKLNTRCKLRLVQAGL
jgi:hypothetical protein